MKDSWKLFVIFGFGMKTDPENGLETHDSKVAFTTGCALSQRLRIAPSEREQQVQNSNQLWEGTQQNVL
jgi:hypothetical protein